MEKPFKNNYVHLEPFIHQVGGHSSMLCLDEATVCKPLVPRELKFYQTLPEPVQKFTPKFYGVIEVQVLQEDGGYVTLIATPPECYKPKVSNNKGHIRIRRSGSIEIDGEPQGLFEVDQMTSETADVNRSGSKPMNPWVFKCHRTHLRNLISDIHHEGNSPNFILLENLTWKFTFPCILDLKMGTRQYGDTASLPKKQSKMYKVVSTTSGKLGARIGGMQVYQVTTQRFLCRNKFYGRSLSIAGFQQALCQFLHNGARLRSDVLPPLIRRLEELVVVLAHQDSVRFYTTSLLLLYEGNEVHSPEPCHFDFKNTSAVCEFDSASRTDEDHRGCMGRRSSSAETLSPVPDGSFERLITDDLPHHHRRSSSTLIYEESHGGSSSSPHDSSLSTPISPLPNTLPESTSEPVVDVRMIDFAHSTHKELDDPVVYSGPDRGFLFGLENMIALLKGIERDHG
ncbi:inositol hexakisphosphate kinase 1 [Anabrus simplex]|uniref:inositol hexakisphosphate kinase 1 n=1 Tax=Anabrus simplex TaxID=316456 RepID=UPI0035A38622